MRVHWLWLSRISKITPLQKRKLLDWFGDPEEIYNADDRTLGKITFLSTDQKQLLADKDLSETYRLADYCERKGIGYITLSDSSYPPRLRAGLQGDAAADGPDRAGTPGERGYRRRPAGALPR